MPNKKITALPATPAAALTDLFEKVNDPGGTPTSQKMTLQQILDLIGPFQGNYAGGPPTQTPPASITTSAFDTSNGSQWNWYGGAWHLLILLWLSLSCFTAKATVQSIYTTGTVAQVGTFIGGNVSNFNNVKVSGVISGNLRGGTNMQGTNVVYSISGTNPVAGSFFVADGSGGYTPTNPPFITPAQAAAQITTNIPTASAIVGNLSGSFYMASVLGIFSDTKVVISNNIVISTVHNPTLIAETFDDYPLGSINSASMTNGVGFDPNNFCSLSNGMAIKSYTFLADGPKKYLEITNGEYIRRIAVSNNWSVIKLAISYSVATNGTSNVSTCYWALGMCSSKGAGYGGYSSVNTSNFTGWVSSLQDTNVASQGEALQYVANNGFPLLRNNATSGGYKTIRSHISTNIVANATGGLPYFPTQGSSRRNLFYVVIYRNNSGATGNLQAFDKESNNGISFDCNQRSISQVINYGAAQVTPTSLDVYWTVCSLATSPVSDAQGELDSINFYWNQPVFAVQIYGIYGQVIY